MQLVKGVSQLTRIMKRLKLVMISLLLAVLFVGFLFLPVRLGSCRFESYVQSLGRHRAGRGRVSLCPLHRAVHTRQRHHHRLGNFVWPVDRFYRRRYRRQSRRALLISPGARVSCAKKSRLGVRESEISLPRPGHRQAGFQDGFADPLEPGVSIRLAELSCSVSRRCVRRLMCWPTLLGMLPATFLFVYIGAAARDALAGQADASAGFYQTILKYVGLAGDCRSGRGRHTHRAQSVA